MTAPKDNSLLGAESCSTLGDWLHFATGLYRRHKLALGQVADSAHDEALYLLLRTMGLPLDSEPKILKRKLDDEDKALLEGVFHRRVVERVPAAYITQEAWLGENRFFVDARVIIPRSYFLEIIPQQLNDWLAAPASVRHVADVCTGSGCLAILLARHFPKARVDAIDLSPDALEVARINVAAYRLARRIVLFESNVFDEVPEEKYDVIVSNPPYEPSGHVDLQAREFKAEPRMAHDGGKDGLHIIRKLLRQAKRRLSPDGIVLLEVGGLRAAMDREFKSMQPHWLHTEDGSNCVCVIHRKWM